MVCDVAISKNIKTLVIIYMFKNTMVWSVAINSLEITLILQPARSDVKIGPGPCAC